MSVEKKTLKQSKLGLVLFVIAVLSGVSGLIPSKDGFVTVLGIAGYVLASMFHARRVLDDGSRAFLKKIYFVLCGVSPIASILGALIAGRRGFFTVLDAISGAAAMAVLILLADRKFSFIETCSDTVFFVTLAVCILVAPSVLVMFAGLLSTIIALAIAVLGFLLVLKAAPDVMSEIASQPTVQYQTKYIDAEGGEHDTAYSRDVANENIANKD